MGQPIATLLVGILTAAVTVGGWIVLHYFTVRREAEARQDARQKELEARLASDARVDRLKRLEILLKQTESQIAEFYGPIMGLIQQVWATWEVKHLMEMKLDPSIYQKVDHYVGERYFLVLHEKIRSILREKMHLLEGVSMPDSFYNYIKHSVMENIQINLWDEKQIDTSSVEGIGWPDQFPDDVKKGLRIAMQRQEDILAELRSTQSQIQKHNMPINVKYQYLLYLPPEYEKNTKDRWPLIVFLHGAGERGNDLEKVKTHGPPKIIKEGQELPFVVVSPQCPEKEGWGIPALNALLDEVMAHNRIDPDRVYLTGLSMGGTGTWTLAAAHPDRFAAIVPICGDANTGDASKLKKIAVWAFHGKLDPTVPVAYSTNMVEAIEKAGGNNVKLTVYPEAKHDSWTETYKNPYLYTWLLEQQRL
jgi:pimeloyl-ACP methyl ester carboxylesterase